MIKKFLLASSALALVAGCASSNSNYTPPKLVAINNQIYIKENFDTVWNRLIKNLSSDFFVINNVEKASRIINVSFSTNNPENYIDCGFSKRSFNNVRGEQNYSYASAASSQFMFVHPQNGVAFNAYRQTKLEGRANIYVEPSENDSIAVSVNTKYILTIAMNYTNLAGQPVGNESFTSDFSTKEPYRDTVNSDGNSPLVCGSNGKLEDKILSYAR